MLPMSYSKRPFTAASTPSPAPPLGDAEQTPAIWAIPAAILSMFLLLVYWGYAGDDTFIHMQYARNMAEGNGFSFNAGSPSYGSTGPLWTLLLAGVGSLSAGDYLIAAKGMGYLCSALAVVAFFFLARQVLVHRVPTVTATLAFVVDPWFLKWGGSGMETPLAVLLALWAMNLHVLRRRQGGIPASAFILGVATTVRPEFIGLFGLFWIDRAFIAKRPPVELALVIVLYVVPLFPWLLFSLGEFGDIIPATVRAKSGHAGVLDVFVRTVKVLGASYAPYIVLAVIGAFVAKRRGKIGSPAVTGMLWAWVIALPVAYVATRSYVASRYLLISTPFWILLGFAGVCAIRTDAHGRRQASTALLAVAILVSVVIQATVIFPRTRFTQGVDDNLLEIGRWVRDHTPENALIAVHEVGAVGFTCERPVLDTAGLVTKEALPYVVEGRVADLVADTRPAYYVSSGDPRIDIQVFEPYLDRMTLLFERPVRRGGSSSRFAEPMPMGVYAFDWTLPIADDESVGGVETSAAAPGPGGIH
jgi:hypothetical protein